MISSLILLIMSFADILIPYLIMCFFTEDYFSQKKIIVIYTLSVLLNILHWHFLVIQLSVLIMYIVLNKERLLQYHIKPIYIILLFVMIHVLTGYVCHLIINAILNDKIRKNTYIKFNIRCKCSDSVFIEDVDLNMLLSNVLDNAIEYLNSHDLVDKYIDVNIIEHQNILVVSVKNPTYQSFNYDSNMGTTKKDKLNHGYGLSIIKNIVNRYDGNVEFESSNNTFSVNILLKGDTPIC